MKKVQAIILTLALVLCMVPGVAFAETIKYDIGQAPDDLYYTGNQIVPSVTVYRNSVANDNTVISTTVLKQNEDYFVTPDGDSTNVGGNKTATVSLRGSTTTALGKINFEIKARDLAGNVKYDNLNGKAFDSDMSESELIAAIKAAVIYRDPATSVILNLGNDVDVSVRNVTTSTGTVQSGQKIVEFKPKSGNHNVVGTGTATIFVGHDLSHYTLTGLRNVNYTGKPVTLTGTSLQRKSTVGTSGALQTIAQNANIYDLVFENDNNTHVGVVRVKAVARANSGYIGETAWESFSIQSVNISSVSASQLQIRDIPNQIYTGSALTPTIEVTETIDGVQRALTQNIDYQVTYQNNAAQGTATASISFIRDYTGTKTLSFRIISSENDLSRPNIGVSIAGASGGSGGGSLGASTTVPYNGAVQRPTVVITDSRGIQLVENAQYQLVFRKDGITTGSPKNAGTYDIYIEGIGVYGGEQKIGTFVITQSSITDNNVTVSGLAASYPFQNGLSVKPSVIVYYGSNRLTENVDYTLSYGPNNSTGAKAGSVTITGINNFTGYRTMTFDIAGIDISGFTVTLRESSVRADGAPKFPTISSVRAGSTLLSSVNYDVTYQDDTGATVTTLSSPGRYKVIVTGKNGYAGSAFAEFRIVGNPQTIKIEKTAFKVYTTSQPFKINAKATGDGTGFRYTSNNPSVATVDENGKVTMHRIGRAVITVTTIGMRLSEPVHDEVYVKVYPRRVIITEKPKREGSSAFRVRWKKQNNVTKYQICYCRFSDFRAGTYGIKTVSASTLNYTTQSTKITTPRKGITYYVKVRAIKEVYNEKGTKLTYYGNWSNWRSVKVK